MKMKESNCGELGKVFIEQEVCPGNGICWVQETVEFFTEDFA